MDFWLLITTPVGASEPGPLVPGGAYEVGFNARPGDRLSFASMFVQSNDWFITPNQAGLALFNNDGTPITGDVTSQIHLWDSGTEINQEPGHAYEFSFEAAPGDYLSFATMFVQSNDLFYGPAGRGIALFRADGAPIRGNVTSQVLLWDAGTEVNQAPGFGADQAPRQAGPNSGADEKRAVHVVRDGFSYSATANTIRVTLTVQ